MHKLKFSLVVATLGRIKELEDLLLSIEKQTINSFELIIVDQNNSDLIHDIIKKFNSKFLIKHIEITEKGASNARNKGIDNSEGEIICFPDDDCLLDDDFLEKIYNYFTENQNVCGIAINTFEKGSTKRIARLPQKGCVIKKINAIYRVIEFGIIIRREKIKEVRFDKYLGVGSSSPWWSDEGPDFVISLIENGCDFLYVPDFIIYHPDPIKIYNEKTILRSKRYGRGRGRFLRKHKLPLWFVFYVWGLYVAGIFIGIFNFNINQSKYYFEGLKGRIKGYFDNSEKIINNLKK